jgi:hypothetical protein
MAHDALSPQEMAVMPLESPVTWTGDGLLAVVVGTPS